MKQFPRVKALKKHICVLALLIVLISIHILFALFPLFADSYNRSFGEFFRSFGQKLTSWIPFSFAEYLMLVIPITAICVIYTIFRSDRAAFKKVCNGVFLISMVLSTLYSAFVLTFAAGYHTIAISKQNNITEDMLSGAAIFLAEHLNDVSTEIHFTDDQGSTMPMSYSELFEKLNGSYASLDSSDAAKSGFYSCPKTVALSAPMTYTHISGVYSFFTGEANINVNYPDFIIPYTAAHEMSHQQGIAREDEANYAAYLICENSDDPYLRYSAYLNMFEFIANDLFVIDRDKYNSVYASLSEKVKEELNHYSVFFEKYRNSNISELSGKVNDVYLTAQGTEGVVTYKRVTELFIKLLNDRSVLTNS